MSNDLESKGGKSTGKEELNRNQKEGEIAITTKQKLL